MKKYLIGALIGLLCVSQAIAASNTPYKTLNQVISTTGALKSNGSGTVSQAACGDLSNSGTACQATAPQTISSVSHEWLNSFTASTGAFTQAQPACADISNAGTVCTQNTGTSGANVPLLNGNNVWSGTDAVTSTSTPTQASGTLGLAGTAAKPTLGATSEGDVFLTAADGFNLIGDGSTNDLRLWNKSGTSVCTVATGTTNFNCTGLQVGGTAVLTANQTITLSGDTTGSGTTAITTSTVKVNGGSIPASAHLTGTNVSSQFVAAAASDVVALFSTCSGSQYLGADGACHTASGAGTVTGITAGTGLSGGTITTSGTISADTSTLARDICVTFDGSGSALTAGKIIYLANIPYGGTITGNTMLADQSGSAVVDVWKVAYASAPPTVTNTITASDLPTLSSAQKSHDTTLTGWTTTVTAGDTMAFKLNSASTITELSLCLQVTTN